MDFRTRLRQEIEFSGLLDKEVAAKAGITKRAIDSYVGSQGCMPSADVAVKIAKVLGVSVEYLVTGNDERTEENPIIRKININLSKCNDFDKEIILELSKKLSERNLTESF